MLIASLTSIQLTGCAKQKGDVKIFFRGPREWFSWRKCLLCTQSGGTEFEPPGPTESQAWQSPHQPLIPVLSRWDGRQTGLPSLSQLAGDSASNQVGAVLWPLGAPCDVCVNASLWPLPPSSATYTRTRTRTRKCTRTRKRTHAHCTSAVIPF